MATVVLSAAGAAIGSSIGGTVAGLSTAVVGRAIGATIGRVIDQKLMGQGSEVVETGKVDRFRLNNAGEGDPVARVYGRVRVSGQVIWASDFAETLTVTESGGSGKGARPAQPKTITKEYSYSVSLAIALCEGEILRVGRVWANGEEVSASQLNMRVYSGSGDQLPDPTMEAIEGAGRVPAYRGTAYVVMDNIPLEQFGNRVPQFSFEIIRAEQRDEPGAYSELALGLRGLALMPGTGEYALATSPVTYGNGGTWRQSANVNTPSGQTNMVTSMDAMAGEVPGCQAVSLIVSWFGNDLRCGQCQVQPKVERKDIEGMNMPWNVSGLGRQDAQQIASAAGRPVYGSTPTDQSVIEAIRYLRDTLGQAVMFYPFILMDQLAGNTLADPYSAATTQPALPWRGRITLSKAPGQTGSPDGTALADAEVDAFFGTVSAADFQVSPGSVVYTGPGEWSLSRMVLHYAALCAAAGGVEAFCIGSEMRGLTQIRGAAGFRAVERFRVLAAQVRQLVGPATKISYAADWSEYFGYVPTGTADRYFHLDPLWADANIDFVGIDNYMPLSDWRDGVDHTDADWESIYNLDYLRANVAGGEGYDWYYHSQQAAEAQIRTPIEDGAHGEAWIWRYKDIRNWWENYHHERVDGVRQVNATDWVPGSKPIWFTEYGCAAIDKGTNQPNKFLDPKSSESRLPKFSTGGRDDLIQKQYYRAMTEYWRDASNNPVSEVYGGPMVNMDRAFAWAWDARPYPFFPNRLDLWSDGENYPRGHWLNGRVSSRSLASVVDEICRKAGLTQIDTSRLYGYVRGYTVPDVGDARSALQPLMLRYGFDAIERDGTLVFRSRDGLRPTELDPENFAETSELDGALEQSREAEANLAGRVRLRFVEADGNFDAGSEEAVLPDEATHAIATTDVALSMTRGEGRQVAERWLSEARVARETARFALPPSHLAIGAGDVVSLPGDQGEGPGLYRVDRVELGASQLVEAVRIDPGVYQPSDVEDELARMRIFNAPVPLIPLFMDLPLMFGDESEHAPHLAVTGTQWPGSAAVFSSLSGENFSFNTLISARSTIGTTRSALPVGAGGLVDRGAALEVELAGGTLSSVTETALLGGANLAAIGDGSPGGWELFQFQTAELIAPNRYLLSRRLRGQLGTDAKVPAVWPSGSWFVLLNGAAEQIQMPSSLLRIEQTFRVGPASLGYEDASYVEETHTFNGNGLRPYAPVHLRSAMSGGDLSVRWIRRTRLDGDSWDLPEVPLGEARESYRVRVHSGGVVVRETEVASPEWTYLAGDKASDGITGGFEVSVSQVSDRFGEGPAARMAIAS